MPWHIVEDSRGCPTTQSFAVVKDADGSIEGCHETKQGAEDQMAALYAGEEQRKKRVRLVYRGKANHSHSQV